MTASRRDMRRAIDFSAVRDPYSMLNCIQALLSRRSDPMREKEIVRWFGGTPKDFTSKSIAEALSRGFIKGGASSLHRGRRVMVYWV